MVDTLGRSLGDDRLAVVGNTESSGAEHGQIVGTVADRHRVVHRDLETGGDGAPLGAAEGESRAADEVMPLVYEQLRRIANARMASERRDHTLQATALVHEAYARMLGGTNPGWESRRHFYAAAAESMRRILIDHARARRSQKRGGEARRAQIDLASLADLASDENAEPVIALDGALARLEGVKPRAAEVVKLRFFAGLGVEEAASALGVSPRTVNLDWNFARAWLYAELERELNAQEGTRDDGG